MWRRNQPEQCLHRVPGLSWCRPHRDVFVHHQEVWQQCLPVQVSNLSNFQIFYLKNFLLTDWTLRTWCSPSQWWVTALMTQWWCPRWTLSLPPWCPGPSVGRSLDSTVRHSLSVDMIGSSHHTHHFQCMSRSRAQTQRRSPSTLPPWPAWRDGRSGWPRSSVPTLPTWPRLAASLTTPWTPETSCPTTTTVVAELSSTTRSSATASSTRTTCVTSPWAPLALTWALTILWLLVTMSNLEQLSDQAECWTVSILGWDEKTGSVL